MQKIISISGLAGAGKDSIGQVLQSKYNFTKFSFSGPLKDATSAIFGWERDILEGATPEAREQREKLDPWWSSKLGKEVTMRSTMIDFGTRVMRDTYHPSIWSLSTERKLLDFDGNVVFTDTRYPEEYHLLKERGATMVRVIRGEAKDWMLATSIMSRQDALSYMNRQHPDVHSSEWEHTLFKYDVIVYNNQTLGHIEQLADYIYARSQ